MTRTVDRREYAPVPPDDLLERALAYARGCVAAVPVAAGPDWPAAPTPCAGWDLGALLDHLNDSLAALREGIGGGHIAPARTAADPVPPAEPVAPTDPVTGLDNPVTDPVLGFRDRASALLGAWAALSGSPGPAGASGAPRAPRTVLVADRPLAATLVAAVGAVEIAVHGWDIGRACGLRRPIPPGLAGALLPVAHCFVEDADRGQLFAAPVPVPPDACPGDRLVAFLGRSPGLPGGVPGTGD
ncbi:maleylpyruvate isomerase family mycothiol-dependent enzyme [Streptomyces sp. NPDC091292]|uniref:maleylpyruvate isomerase family mycothiol-dependent enzyme n=1 Tax=Streptomyces sp. NPDC091292 TaxID=3365991 RepID=UPI00380705D3